MNTSVIRGDWAGLVIDSRFALLEWLGGSESSQVFLTELAGDPPQKAAIKLMPADAGDAEARVAAWAAATELAHPHLLRLLHTGRCRIDDSELLYAVTEYADENLGEILPERPLTPDETREMLDPVLDALSYLHRKNFVHGHLKPSNIMVVGERLKLSVDRLYLSSRLWEHLPTPGAYDAPETATRMSPAADVWSLGMTLVEALTQHRPRWDKSTGTEPIVPESVPQPFAGIARECLRRDPMRRCTIDQIKLSLGGQRNPELEPAAVETRPVAARALSEVVRRGEKWTPEAPRRFLPAAIIAAVLTLLVVIAIWRYNSHKSAPENAGISSSSSEPATSSESATTVPTTRPGTQATGAATAGSTAKGAVVERVMPDVLPYARETIHGTVHVGVRVTVDPSGDVSNATLESPGPSRYFAKVALEASRRWRFKTAQVSSTWILRYAFRRTGTEVTPVQVSAAGK
jgi:TonB family protein